MTIKELLVSLGALASVVLPPEIDILLSLLEVTAAPSDPDPLWPPPPSDPPDPRITTGWVKLNEGGQESPIPGLDFGLHVPTGSAGNAPFKILVEDPPEQGFKFWLMLSKAEKVYFAYRFLQRVAGLGLTGATLETSTDGRVSLAARSGSDAAPILVCRSTEVGAQLAPSLLVVGTTDSPASIRFTPDTDSVEGVVAFGLEPKEVVFGGSNIGFVCPVMTIDDSGTATAPGLGAPGLDPPLDRIDADDKAWRGLLAREIDFYLPADLPYIGGRAIKGYLAIPFGHGGVHLVVETKVPPHAAEGAQPSRLGFSVRIECIDPTARGLSGLLPTLISASLALPLNGAKPPIGDLGPITFVAGEPVTLTLTLARDPVNAPGMFSLTIALQSQGEDGLLSVVSRAGDAILSPPKVFNTAAALATALIADQNLARNKDVGGAMGVALPALAAGGAAVSSLFEPDSRFVLHGAEISSTGHGMPLLNGKLTLSLDYSVAVRVVQINIPAAISVSMRKDQPMRIRVRRVAMSIDPSQGGLSSFALDYDRAEMEIEDPGAWDVSGLKQLFDVLGTRSGRGSTWIEVDLRFKLNLGPVKVSGLTIRATLRDGLPEVSVSGLAAELSIPGAIHGQGAIQLIPGGFDASIAAQLYPLNVGLDASIDATPPKIVLGLAVDLPAPIPLANSGFGLFGIGGEFGVAAVPDYGVHAGEDPVWRQLSWKPSGPGSFATKPGESTFGFSAIVGTLPDLGFSFSSKASLFVSVPDVAVRGALNGRILQPAMKMADEAYPPSEGISFLGFIGIDATALNFGVLGHVKLDPLLEVKVPVTGYFPFKQTDNWYLYVGADGYHGDGRDIGPISAKVLPGILDIGADAYLMFRGRGIIGWPYGRPVQFPPINDGFVVAFGFALQSRFGASPIAWAELHASVDLLLASRPPTLAGFGSAGGSLHLGPFSAGVQAQLSFIAQGALRYLWAEVRARIELLFFDVEGKVTLSYGTSGLPQLPPPDRHPLDRFDDQDNRIGSSPTLTDDTYRVVATLREDPEAIRASEHVWPDAMISLPFAVGPDVQVSAGNQFPGVLGPDAKPIVTTLGTEMLVYTWQLNALSLVDVTNEADKFNGTGEAPPGQLSARWQTPRGVSGVNLSELVLFSAGADLWVNRLADAGEGQQPSPLDRAAALCKRREQAQPGWALGVRASHEVDGFRLPPDSLSMNSMTSRVVAHMHHFALDATGQAHSLDLVRTLPQPWSLNSASIIDYPAPVRFARDFEGMLVVPSLTWPTGQGQLPLPTDGFVRQQIVLDLETAVTDGLLILVGRREWFLQLRLPFLVVADAHDRWDVDSTLAPVTLPDGQVIVAWRPRTTLPLDQVVITFPVGIALGIAGLRGLTTTATAAADAENEAIQNLLQWLADASIDGPKTTPDTNKPGERVILKPGRLYRLDVDMSWSGKLFTQDEQGTRVDITPNPPPDPTTYTLKGGGELPTKRQLFFRTAAQKSISLVSGQAAYAQWLYQRQDTFAPEMIERYFGGYQPAQSELFWFCDDMIRAHFTQDHVAALAKAYGYTLVLAVRRTDEPGTGAPPWKLLGLTWAFATTPDHLSHADHVRYEKALTSSCRLPRPGASATAAPVDLEPETWYEMHVRAKADDAARVADGSLPGLTFRTSRWRTPEDMLAGLGLDIVSPRVLGARPVMTGDLAIPASSLPGAAITLDDDTAFQNALIAMGLDGWPVATAPRLSRLWVAGDNGWLFAGLMMESPEPIHRGARLALDVAGPVLEMGRTGQGVKFDIQRRDRGGARLIYRCATPFPIVLRERRSGPHLPGFPPHGPLGSIYVDIVPRLVFKATASTADSAVDLLGRLTLPAKPAFAEDP